MHKLHFCIDSQEHERIAIAVERAHKTDTKHGTEGGTDQTVYSHYIDSITLFEELRVASDYLAAGLMDSDSDRNSRARFFGQTGASDSESDKARKEQSRSSKRVLPVYVLSLMHPHAPLQIDNGKLVASARNAVIVLQHGNNVLLQVNVHNFHVCMCAEMPSLCM